MRCATFFLALFWAHVASAGGTLVVRGEGGGFAPGVASRWWSEGQTVHFQVENAERASRVAARLKDHLSSAQVSARGAVVSVRGLPERALLASVSQLEIEDEVADPLAALAGAGTDPGAFRPPEGGGSIRATARRLVASPEMLVTPPGRAQFEAEVLAVDREKFPEAYLRLKVRRAALDAPLRASFPKNRVFFAEVLLAGKDGTVDFDAEETQRNLVAYYLRPGDRVIVHALEKDEGVHIDWIRRKLPQD